MQTNFCIAALCFGQTYLEGLAASIVMVFSLLMLAISLQKPQSFMIYLETTDKEIAFTWMGRMVADLFICLFLASMGIVGKIMAGITAFNFCVTLGLAKNRPDIFRDLFRANDNDPSLGTGEDASYNAAP